MLEADIRQQYSPIKAHLKGIDGDAKEVGQARDRREGRDRRVPLGEHHGVIKQDDCEPCARALDSSDIGRRAGNWQSLHWPGQHPRKQVIGQATARTQAEA